MKNLFLYYFSTFLDFECNNENYTLKYETCKRRDMFKRNSSPINIYLIGLNNLKNSNKNNKRYFNKTNLKFFKILCKKLTILNEKKKIIILLSCSRQKNFSQQGCWRKTVDHGLLFVLVYCLVFVLDLVARV